MPQESETLIALVPVTGSGTRLMRCIQHEAGWSEEQAAFLASAITWNGLGGAFDHKLALTQSQLEAVIDAAASNPETQEAARKLRQSLVATAEPYVPTALNIQTIVPPAFTRAEVEELAGLVAQAPGGGVWAAQLRSWCGAYDFTMEEIGDG